MRRRLLMRLSVALLRMSRRTCRCRRCELRRAAAVERWKAKTLTYRDLAEPSEPESPADPPESVEDTDDDGPDLDTEAVPESADRGAVGDQDDDGQGEEPADHEPDQEVHGPSVNPWLAAVMEDFYAARQIWYDSRAAFSKGYPAEEAEFEEQWPRPQLRDFLVDHAARARAETAELIEAA